MISSISYFSSKVLCLIMLDFGVHESSGPLLLLPSIASTEMLPKLILVNPAFAAPPFGDPREMKLELLYPAPLNIPLWLFIKFTLRLLVLRQSIILFDFSMTTVPSYGYYESASSE